MSDPRLSVISRRFDAVKRIIAVSSGKGGVGKSMISVALSLALRDRGFSVGLLDLDFTSPSTHIILGVEGLYPEEEKGITPPETNGLRYMSIVHYSSENPAPLRGADQSNAIIELLAVTRWETLDYLIIDMPPGLGDATLDMLRLVPRIEFLVVSTPSVLAFESVRKLLTLLMDQGVDLIGVLENMGLEPNDYVRKQVEAMKVPFVGEVKWDITIEERIGDPESFRRSHFYSSIKKLSERI